MLMIVDVVVIEMVTVFPMQNMPSVTRARKQIVPCHGSFILFPDKKGE